METTKRTSNGGHCGTDADGKIRISKPLAVGLAALFVGATVAVGLLVYNFADPVGGDNDDSVLATTMSPSTASPPQLLKDVRLPTHLKPLMYDVRLLPFVEEAENWRIDGYVKVYMSCTSPGRNVTLHLLEIVVDESSIIVENVDSGARVTVTDIGYDKARQFMTVNLGEDLRPGVQYSLEIGKFDAVLNDQLAGFYRSKYEHQGSIRYMGVTQFQATDARRAFPCFDEPGVKAKFNVTLGRKNTDDWTTLSNMDAIAEGVPHETLTGYVWDKYAVSVDMSTYLVAFCVSQFQSKTSNTNDKFKVWARSDMIGRTEFAANEGAKILKFFEEYFEIEYPLPKMDMLALTDFSAGAMENWGMITYREEYLLYDPTGRTTSASLLQRIIYIIAHELSHQWFGNLVTPKWWTDLWLNEGFASYVEYLGSQESRKDWKWMQLFIVSEVQDVMRVDSLESSHPIYQEVFNPDQIKELFDRISYGKGATIIRMMNNYLTEATFKKGLISYLKDKSFSNAETEDLWRYLDVAAHDDKSLPDDLSVSQIMNTWTGLTGFPVVTLTRDPKQNTATLTQARFFLQQSSRDQSSEQWFIPINFNAAIDDFNRTSASHWLRPNTPLTLTDKDLASSSLDSWIPDPAKNNWVIVNAQETGYYRVNYDATNWAMIQAQLEADHTKISTENRAQILDDAFNLARAGIISYPTALGLTKYLAKEQEFIPWRATANALAYIDKMLERSAGYGYFREYMKTLLNGTLVEFENLEDIKPEYTQDVTQLFKDVLIQERACKYGVDKCKSDASAQYKEWMTNYDEASPDNATISPNVNSIVYCYGVANGGEEEWNHAWRHYTKTNLASEKTAMLSAMACTEEVWLLSKYLGMTFEKNSTVRSQDAARAFGNIAGSVIGRSLSFDYLLNNFVYLEENFNAGISAMDSFINPFATFNTPAEAARMRAFKEEYENDLGSGARAVDQAIESIEINAQWMAAHEATVTQWLKEQTGHGST